MKCANCTREAHDPVYLVAIQRGRGVLQVLICGHCWNQVFMAPAMSARLERLAFKSAEMRLPGF